MAMKFLPRLWRSYSLQAPSSKSLLAVLRRNTGFPLSKCKAALTQHENDVEAAEKWLYARAREEGWAKAESLSGRPARQGLIGVSVLENRAAMVELNCETDFVARNEKFHSLLASVTRATLLQTSPKPLPTANFLLIDRLSQDNLKSLRSEDGARSLADLVAETVSHLSENLVLSRGCTMSASEGLICSYVYNNIAEPGAQITMGTYAVLVHLLPAGGGGTFETQTDKLQTLGNQIGQHIVGMNPTSVYRQEGSESSEALVEQNFVLDDSRCIGSMLEESNVQVSKFIRFGLGGAVTSS